MLVEKLGEGTYVEHDDEMKRKTQSAKDLGIAGTVLGAVAVAGLWGRGGLNGLFGGCGSNATTAAYEQAQVNQIRDKECEDNIALTRAIYDARITELKEAYATRDNDISEKFSLYNFTQNRFLSMSDRIADLEKEVAVAKAVRPYQDKILSDGIALVGQQAANAVALEAERRCCADGKLVTYMNGTFTPEYIATQTPGATTVTYTQKSVYNPLCGCCGNRYSA